MGHDLLSTVTVAFELLALFLLFAQSLQDRTDVELYNSVIALPSVGLF